MRSGILFYAIHGYYLGYVNTHLVLKAWLDTSCHHKSLPMQQFPRIQVVYLLVEERISIWKGKCHGALGTMEIQRTVMLQNTLPIYMHVPVIMGSCEHGNEHPYKAGNFFN
jgi:hypothetical protein